MLSTGLLRKGANMIEKLWQCLKCESLIDIRSFKWNIKKQRLCPLCGTYMEGIKPRIYNTTEKEKRI